MPLRDKTGPRGEGPATGLGLGPCAESGESSLSEEQLEAIIRGILRRSRLGGGRGDGRGGGRGAALAEKAAFVRGFSDRCVEVGVDPEKLVKHAQAAPAQMPSAGTPAALAPKEDASSRLNATLARHNAALEKIRKATAGMQAATPGINAGLAAARNLGGAAKPAPPPAVPPAVATTTTVRSGL